MLEYKIFINILLYSIVPTLIALYVTQRVKGTVKNLFDSKLEKLKKEHSIEIAKFQTELNFLKSKENFKFTKLHEARLEVFAETYKNINENLMLLKKYILKVEDKSDDSFTALDEEISRMEYQTAYKKFYDYFSSKVIYFDEDTELLIEGFFEEAATIRLNHSEMKIDYPNEEIDFVITESYKAILIKLKPIKKEIENKFRKLLGE